MCLYVCQSKHADVSEVQVPQSCLTLCDPHELYCPWNSPGQNSGMGSLSLFQGIFPTQGSNPGLLHCRQILYQLSHEGSPGILKWVAYPFSRGSSQPRNWTGVSCITGGFFTSWNTREALLDGQWYHLSSLCLHEDGGSDSWSRSSRIPRSVTEVNFDMLLCPTPNRSVLPAEHQRNVEDTEH